MATQIEQTADIPLNGIGAIGRIKNPKVLDGIISQMPEGYVACDFLNRTIGGVTSALVFQPKAQERYEHDHLSWDASDEKLMKMYTKEDLILQRDFYKSR